MTSPVSLERITYPRPGITAGFVAVATAAYLA
jgi:hypothetical protein